MPTLSKISRTERLKKMKIMKKVPCVASSVALLIVKLGQTEGNKEIKLIDHPDHNLLKSSDCPTSLEHS